MTPSNGTNSPKGRSQQSSQAFQNSVRTVNTKNASATEHMRARRFFVFVRAMKFLTKHERKAHQEALTVNIGSYFGAGDWLSCSSVGCRHEDMVSA
jgi:hypothetical protein